MQSLPVLLLAQLCVGPHDHSLETGSQARFGQNPVPLLDVSFCKSRPIHNVDPVELGGACIGLYWC